MSQLARILMTVLLLGTAAPALAHPQTSASNLRSPQSPPNTAAANTTPAYMAANRILGYTAWDDDYFYIALQINKPVLSGKNTQPFSDPLEDDAAIITLQTDDDH